MKSLTTGRYIRTDTEDFKDPKPRYSVKVWHSMSVIHGASGAGVSCLVGDGQNRKMVGIGK